MRKHKAQVDAEGILTNWLIIERRECRVALTTAVLLELRHPKWKFLFIATHKGSPELP